jgi:hypothetical protein
MTAVAMRQELKNYIDTIPEATLPTIEPLLSFLANIGKPKVIKRSGYTIETDLTAEEKSIIAEGRKHHKEHPDDFVSMNSVNWN